MAVSGGKKEDATVDPWFRTAAPKIARGRIQVAAKLT
jgi:hypothetical protein